MPKTITVARKARPIPMPRNKYKSCSSSPVVRAAAALTALAKSAGSRASAQSAVLAGSAASVSS